MTLVQYRRAFVALREDPRWKSKLAIGVGISLIPYVGMVWLAGWQMQYQRSVAWGRDELLPEWSDFNGQMVLGFKGLVSALPYSMVLSCILTAALTFAGMFTGFAAATDSYSPWQFAAFLVTIFVLLIATTLLMLPLTSSVVLRVALYGTIGSGFELKEIWRLMRENKPALLRAWGLTAANVAIGIAAMLTYFGLVATIVVITAKSAVDAPVVPIALAVLGYIAYYPLQMTLSMYLGVASTHFFGSYGRVAYRLAQVAEQP